MSDPIPKSEILARRAIDVVYNHHGRSARYLPTPGGMWVDVVVLARVQDHEEDISGSELAFTRRGFQMRMRTYTLAANNIVLSKGTKLELDAPFQGHTVFHLDSAPSIYGRVGLQWICGVTPSADKIIDVPPVPSAAAEGYNF